MTVYTEEEKRYREVDPTDRTPTELNVRAHYWVWESISSAARWFQISEGEVKRLVDYKPKPRQPLTYDDLARLAAHLCADKFLRGDWFTTGDFFGDEEASSLVVRLYKELVFPGAKWSLLHFSDRRLRLFLRAAKLGCLRVWKVGEGEGTRYHFMTR